jgi:hypothetical protein
MVEHLTFSSTALKQVQDLLKDPVFSEIRRRETVRGWRNEVTADWVENFMHRMQTTDKSNAPTNPKTGKPHTVESMVEELKERVQLSAINKTAAAFPLTIKQAEFEKKKISKDDLENAKSKIAEFIDNMYGSHRGYVDAPAALFECRKVFGQDIVHELSDFITDEITKAHKIHSQEGMQAILPAPFLGQPQQVDNSEVAKIFENIKSI